MINDQLKKALLNINFLEKFNKIYEQYPYTGEELKKVSSKVIVEFLNGGEYHCKYDSKHKFYNVKSLKEDNYNSSVNFTTKYGVAQFVLNVKINGEGTGGPFTVLSLEIGAEKRIPDPRFSSLDDLKKILMELLFLYDEIMKELDSSND